jgi:hypothetical protein
VRITEVFVDAPMDAINKGRNTTEGIERKKLRVPRVTFSPEAQRAMEIPINKAIKEPRTKPTTEIARVTLIEFQKNVVNTSGIKSLITLHEWGKLLAFASAEAISQRTKLTTAMATHFLRTHALCMHESYSQSI